MRVVPYTHSDFCFATVAGAHCISHHAANSRLLVTIFSAYTGFTSTTKVLFYIDKNSSPSTHNSLYILTGLSRAIFQISFSPSPLDPHSLQHTVVPPFLLPQMSVERHFKVHDDLHK